MRGLAPVVAGLAAVGLWIWFWHGLGGVPAPVKSGFYVVGSVAAFYLAKWIVDKAYEVFTGQP